MKSTVEERMEIINELEKMKDDITMRAIKVAKQELGLEFLIKKGELARDGIIFGSKHGKIVTEIRIRQWEEED